MNIHSIHVHTYTQTHSTHMYRLSKAQQAYVHTCTNLAHVHIAHMCVHEHLCTHMYTYVHGWKYRKAALFACTEHQGLGMGTVFLKWMSEVGVLAAPMGERQVQARENPFQAGKRKRVTCKGGWSPQMHVTCLSSWVSSSEMSGSLICS